MIANVCFAFNWKKTHLTVDTIISTPKSLRLQPCEWQLIWADCSVYGRPRAYNSQWLIVSTINPLSLLSILSGATFMPASGWMILHVVNEISTWETQKKKISHNLSVEPKWFNNSFEVTLHTFWKMGIGPSTQPTITITITINVPF